MTEQEREELIEKMARDIGAACGYRITPWRYRIVKAHARAALAVAEPVIREQADNALREENARLREVVKNAYYEGWQDRESVAATEDQLHSDWMCSEARAAIRENGT